MKAQARSSHRESRAAAAAQQHGYALPAPAQLKPAYKKIYYDPFSGDTSKCYDHRFKTNNWSDKTNLGLISGSGNIHAGSNDEGHSEEKIVEEVTGVKFNNQQTAEQNAQAVLAFVEQPKIDLYTELEPCYGGLGNHNCSAYLNLVLSDDSTVTYSAQSRVEKAQMLQSAKEVVDGYFN